MTTQKKIGIFILLFILVAFSGFIAWSNNVMEVQENAKAAMKGSESVQVVTDEGFLEFVPSEGN